MPSLCASIPIHAIKGKVNDDAFDPTDQAQKSKVNQVTTVAMDVKAVVLWCINLQLTLYRYHETTKEL